jgi:sialic acid synthase SpsE
MSVLKIGPRIVGAGRPPLVIAEIGVNHDGSVDRALELVGIAAECGADAVKLQLFSADRLMHGAAAFAAYQKARCEDASPARMLRRYELSEGESARVVQAIRAKGLIPLATPFSPADVQAVERFNLPAVKIASPDLVNRPLLQCAARLGRPLIVSTGASAMQEVEATVWWLREWGVGFALMHCVSSYPTPAEQANLCWIGELSSRFDVVAGFSDHTTDSLAGALAVAAGAGIVEKHLTYDRSAAGPDHAASADPEQFARYVRSVRDAHRMVGRPGKRVLKIEQDVRKVSRQSLVARCRLAVGQTIREEDLTVKRPGTGIPAAMIERVAGRRMRCDVEPDTLLTWDMLADAA